MDPGPVRFSIVLGRDPHHRNPLALAAKMSESERNDLEFGRRGGLASAEELDTTPPGIRYGTSIQRFPFFYKHSIWNLLLTLCRRLWNAMESSHSSRAAFSWSYRSWFWKSAWGWDFHQTMHFERKPSTFPSRFFTADTTCHTPLKEGPISIVRPH